MTEEVKHPLDDVSVTLEYTVKELNALLNLLGQLKFIEAVGAINSIQMQAGPQVERAREGIEAALKAVKEKENEPKATA